MITQQPSMLPCDLASTWRRGQVRPARPRPTPPHPTPPQPDPEAVVLTLPRLSTAPPRRTEQA